MVLVVSAATVVSVVVVDSSLCSPPQLANENIATVAIRNEAEARNFFIGGLESETWVSS